MKRIVLMLMMALPLAAIGQKSSLTLTVTGMDAGSALVMSEAQDGRLLPMDTLYLDAKGTVKVTRQGDEPGFFVLQPATSRGAVLHCLLLPREKVSLTVDYLPTRNQFYVTAVKGSQNMELYGQFSNLMADATEPESQAALPDRVEGLLRQNSSLLMSAFLVTYFESAFEQYAPLYKELRDALVGRYANNEFVKHLDQKLRSVVMVGMDAPDIALPDSAGVVRRLSDLRGKVVLIDFWASWCGPCRMENPNVVRVYQKYHDKGFEVFSVSLDNSREKWVQAIKKDNLLWPNHVSDLKGWSSAGGKLYGISSIPATVLVDRDGKVLARNLRGPKLEQQLKEIFGE